MTNVVEVIKGLESKLHEFREELHRFPEISYQEFETTKRIAERLDKHGISYRRMEPTGILGEIKGNHPGKTILLRSDIDALPVTEDNQNIDYSSQVEGKMHACGHDVHTAMLMTALVALNGMKDEIHGTVRFVFQPAEEYGNGALAMIEQGAVDGVDQVFGLHVMTSLPTGHLGTTIGPFMAASDFFDVTFTGRGGHGAMPHLSIDPVVMASNFVMTAQTAVSRLVDPFEGGVLTIGSINGGHANNVIPGEVKLSGTTRTFYPGARDTIEDAVHKMAHQIAGIYGGQAEVNYDRLTTVVQNDEDSYALLKETFEENFDADHFHKIDPVMAGEDFGHYTDQVPGIFAFVGGYNEEKDMIYPNHHEKFNVDEDSFVTGAVLHAQYALNYLKKTAK